MSRPDVPDDHPDARWTTAQDRDDLDRRDEEDADDPDEWPDDLDPDAWRWAPTDDPAVDARIVFDPDDDSAHVEHRAADDDAR